MKAHIVILRSRIEMVKLKHESDQICRLGERDISRISTYKILLSRNLLENITYRCFVDVEVGEIDVDLISYWRYLCNNGWQYPAQRDSNIDI